MNDLGRADLGITVYGCEHDEATLFRRLAPRRGLIPTITSAAVSEFSALTALRNPFISVGHRSAVTASTLRALRRTGVRYLSTRSIGVDHIDLQAAAEVGITVENVVYAPDGVADFTLMLMLMAVRDARGIVGAARAGDYRLRATRGRELRDLTVGVIGVGRIGSAVVTRLRGFGCRVLAHGSSGTPSGGAEYVALDELLRASDVVTLHPPLTADTRHLIGRAQFDAMKPGAILVNTGRGGLVDTDALIAALESGRLGGAALDVLEGEERHFAVDRTADPPDDPRLVRLQRLPNVILTPHTAFSTDRAMRDTVERTLTNCLAFERSRARA